MFLIFALILGNKGIIYAFGFENQSNFLYLFLFMKLYMPVSFAAQFISNHLNRKAEYKADAFAVKYNHGKALKSNLIKQYRRNKRPLVAD